jgi:hypothetical protein
MVWTVRDSNLARGKRFYASIERSQWLWAHQPPVDRLPVFPPGIKRPWRVVNRSPPSGAEVKNKWSYTPTPSVCFHVLAREKFNFTF